VSSMLFSVLKTISPPILDSTEVIQTGFMLCRDTRTRSHSNKAPPQAPKRGSRHISRILDGYVVSSMLFSVLKTISPPISDSTEVIQTGFMLCRHTRTRSHSYKAPPQAPKRGSRHISRILDGYVVSSMLFSILKTISPPILDSTEVIQTGFMLCRDTRTRSHSYKAPPQAPKCGSRHISRILDGYVVSSMSFRILKTISPPILDSTEVIHTGFMLCRDTRTRSHSYKAPPLAPKRGSRHRSWILDGFTCIFFDFCPFLKKNIWLCQECTHY
jgi:hypothetical protein